MNSRQGAIVVVLALVAVGLAAVPASAQATNDTAENETETNMGAQLTAFMQASAAETSDTVESGMWAAGFERANESERAQLATDRTARLEQRLERLRARNQTIQERYENGSLSEPAYVAQTSRLTGQIEALQNSIDDTANAAVRAGVATDKIDRLRAAVENVSGPAVPGVAAGIASGQGPPAHAGPAADTGPPTDGADTGPPTDGGNSEAGPSTETANASAQGPPATTGPSTDAENASVQSAAEGGTGPPADPGNATGGAETGAPDDPGASGPENASDGGGSAGPGERGAPNESDGGSSDSDPGQSGGTDSQTTSETEGGDGDTASETSSGSDTDDGQR